MNLSYGLTILGTACLFSCVSPPAASFRDSELARELRSFDKTTDQRTLDKYAYKLIENQRGIVYNSKIIGRDIAIINNVYNFMKENNLLSTYKMDLHYRLFGTWQVNENEVYVDVRTRFMRNSELGDDVPTDGVRSYTLPVAEFIFVVSSKNLQVIRYEELGG